MISVIWANFIYEFIISKEKKCKLETCKVPLFNNINNNELNTLKEPLLNEIK